MAVGAVGWSRGERAGPFFSRKMQSCWFDGVLDPGVNTSGRGAEGGGKVRELLRLLIPGVRFFSGS